MLGLEVLLVRKTFAAWVDIGKGQVIFHGLYYIMRFLLLSFAGSLRLSCRFLPGNNDSGI